MYSIKFSNDEADIPLLYWKGPKKGSPVFHWAHATGFNGETYKSLLQLMSTKFHVYAWDLRGHGRSKANTLKIKNEQIYETYVRDLSSLISWLSKKHESKILVGGHSIGGTISISAASRNLESVKSLLLVDPVIFPWYVKYFMAAARYLKLQIPNAYLSTNAKKRKYEWPDIDTLINSYEGRGAFKTWHKPFLINYLKAGTIKNKDRMLLSCHPSWESRNFKAFDSVNIIDTIYQLRLPIRLLVAEWGSTTKALSTFRKNQNCTIKVAKQNTHFIPMENPSLVQTELYKLSDE